MASSRWRAEGGLRSKAPRGREGPWDGLEMVAGAIRECDEVGGIGRNAHRNFGGRHNFSMFVAKKCQKWADKRLQQRHGLSRHLGVGLTTLLVSTPYQ